MNRRDFLKILSFPVALPLIPKIAVSSRYDLPLNSEKRVLEWIDREIGVVPGIGTRAICEATGTYYDEIIWDENGNLWLHWPYNDDPKGPTVARFSSQEMAWIAFAAALDTYRQNRIGKLHWRIKPEMLHVEPGDYVDCFGKVEKVIGGYSVYARLVIDPVRM